MTSCGFGMLHSIRFFILDNRAIGKNGRKTGRAIDEVGNTHHERSIYSFKKKGKV
jgi:hypothetical protein|nr:MAG TPA: hypothetical protein [Caudoviricetes sp.]